MKTMSLDFTAILYCRNNMPKHLKDDLEIGFITSDAPCTLNSYKNHPIFFSKSSYGDYYTIEEPMCKEELERQRKNGSFLSTVGTMVCVPKQYIIPCKGL